MLNSFPQRAVNNDLLLRTYQEMLKGFSDDIICEICRRYVSGEVQDQHKAFAPSVAEFVQSARDLVATRAALKKSIYRQAPVESEPIQIKVARAKRNYEGRALLAKGLDLKQFAWKLQKGELPLTCEFVAVLGAVYANA